MPAHAAVTAPCDTYSWTNEDDNAHLMSLPYSLPLGDTTYDQVYLSTNGTLSFGVNDATYWDYPNTPSISLAGADWVTWAGGNLSYGVNETGFCVLWDVRPFPQSSGDFTHIKLTVDTSHLPSWSGSIETTGVIPNYVRRGIRFAPNTDVLTISEAFTVNGGRPVEMQSCWDGSVIPMTSTCPVEPPAGQCWDGSTIPWNGTCPPIPPDIHCWDGSWIPWSQSCPSEPLPQPTETPTPTPEPQPSIEPTPEPLPSETLTPEPLPSPSEVPSEIPSETPTPIPTPSASQSVDPIPVAPSPSPEPTHPSVQPSPTRVVEPDPTPTPTPDPIVPNDLPSTTPSTVDEVLAQYSPEEPVPASVLLAAGIDYSELPPDQPVTLENGVVILAAVADALQIFESPSEVLSTLFTDPGKALKAIANVGADMTPQTRKKAQQTTVPAVIVTQVISGTASLLVRKP